MNKTVLLTALPLAGLLSLPLTAQAKPPKSAPKPKSMPSVAGDWNGSLNVGGTQLRLVVHFTRQPGGGLAGTLDSLDQGANGIPFSLVRQTGGKVHAEARASRPFTTGRSTGRARRLGAHGRKSPPCR